MVLFAAFLPSPFRWMKTMIMMISIQVILLLLLIAKQPLLTFVHGCQGEIGNLTCTGSNQGGLLYVNVTLYPPQTTSSKTNNTFYLFSLNRTGGDYSTTISTNFNNVTEIMNVFAFYSRDLTPSTINVVATLRGYINYTEDDGLSWITQECLYERKPPSNTMTWQVIITNDTCTQQLLPTSSNSHANRNIILLQSTLVLPASIFVTTVVFPILILLLL